MKPKMFKSILLLIAFAGLVLFLLNNFGVVWDIIGFVLIVITPFIVGLCIAFIINMPYVFFADKAYAGLAKKGKGLQKIRKPLALITAYIIVFGIVAFLIIILIPQLVESFEKLITNFSNYASSFQRIVSDYAKQYFNVTIGDDSDIFQLINDAVKMVTGGELTAFLQNTASYIAPSIFDFTVNFTTNIYNLGMGLIVSFYFLACKDKLLYQTKKLTYAYTPKKYLPKVLQIADLSNRMFGRYIYGRILDSLIVGILCFIGMSIFGFDYALLISVIIGITNVIPVFGPFLGAVPSVFIMLIIDPMEAIWFTVFILILQQIDGNIIGPRIMGSSIGISGFWIMASVIIGGGLFGIIGMFIAVPIFSIIYVLLGNDVNKRINNSEYAQELGKEPDTDIIKQKDKKPFYLKNNKYYRSISGKLRRKK